ncbi:hypothetical protein ST47_g1731 [Ascochyta rabiei]|uniref:Uncharacterized protein n=1 Tax=Didymella rabiei TaxID=5454 RepID=A0A163KNK7_DIDRA|nr:hypothetical protein ST47_g1731 [Ascochyta rabiei]
MLTSFQGDLFLSDQTKSEYEEVAMDKGTDKTSLEILAPAVPAVPCAIKQAPFAITSPIKTFVRVHSLATHAISVVSLPPSSLMMCSSRNLAANTRKPVVRLVEPGAGSLGSLGNDDQMS